MGRTCLILLLLLFPCLTCTSSDYVPSENVEEALRGRTISSLTGPGQGSWFGDIYVLPYTFGSTYDRAVGGVLNIAPRQWVAQSFLQNNADTYDFFLVFTNFSYDLAGADAFYIPIKNDISGLGIGLFDDSDSMDSEVLEGYIDANTIASYRKPDGSLDIEKLAWILNHELAHRWIAHVRFLDAEGHPSEALLGVEKTHWSYLLDSDASYMYGSEWQRNSDGSYTATEVKTRFSPLDLYLMGLIPASEVSPLTLLVNPQIPPQQLPHAGDTIQASTMSVSLDQIVAAVGSRVPDSTAAPHEFRIAVIFLVDPASAYVDDLPFLDSMRTAWQSSFFEQTGGKGLVSASQAAPPVATVSLDILSAVQWLTAAAQADGSWMDTPGTQLRDTSEAVAGLEAAASTGLVGAAVQTLASMSSSSAGLTAQQADCLIAHQQDASVLISRLQSAGSPQNGWGEFPRYAGDPVNTAKVMRALKRGGMEADAAAAWTWLQSVQNPDGGWGWRAGGPSAPYPTLEVLFQARETYPGGFWNDPAVGEALPWLLARQTDGGFGEPYPTVPETSLFLKAVLDHPVSPSAREQAIEFLADRQQTDGSWGGKVYDTALAISALAPYFQPDPYVDAEIFAQPDPAYPDEQVVFHVGLHNRNADLAPGLPYRWDLINKQSGETALSLPGLLNTVLAVNASVPIETTFTMIAISPGDYTLRFTIDPDHQIVERNRDNDITECDFSVGSRPPGVDLSLVSAQAAPQTITAIPQLLTVSGTVRNVGMTEALDATVTVYDGDPALHQVLGYEAVSISAAGSMPYSIPVNLTQARFYTLTVVAESTAESNPADNSRTIGIPLQQREDLAVTSFTAASVQPTAGDLVTLTAEVANRGTVPEAGLQVAFAYTIGSTAWPIQQTPLPGTLQPGDSQSLQILWRPYSSGPMTLTATVDPQQVTNDVDRSNNSRMVEIDVQQSTLADLVIADENITVVPEQPLQGQSVTIQAAIRNAGLSDAGPFEVEFRKNNPTTGPLLTDAVVVAGLASGYSVTESVQWTVDQGQDAPVFVVVDTTSAIAEVNEENNVGLSVVDVQRLPRLAINSGGIIWQPLFPTAEQPVDFQVTVLNLGDQPASGVTVEFIAPGQAPVPHVIEVPGNGQGQTSFNWIPSQMGETTITVRVNNDDAISASVTLAVQDSDLFVSNRYFSPNGDGSQDTTTVYFREPSSSVQIKNADGERVRTLPVTAGASSVVWDGKNQDGVVVEDGSYQILAGSLSTFAVVDDNLSSISKNPTGKLIRGEVGHPEMQDYVLSANEDEIFFLLADSFWADARLAKYNGRDFIEIGPWPAAYSHWHGLRGCSNDGSVCLAGCDGTCDFAIVREPSGSFQTFEFGNDPEGSRFMRGYETISPDGRWVAFANMPEHRAFFILQSTENLEERYTFDPCNWSDCYGFHALNSIKWAPDSSRLVASAAVWVSAQPRVNVIVVDTSDPSASQLLHDLPLPVSCPPATDPVGERAPVQDQMNYNEDFESAVDFSQEKIILTNGDSIAVYDLRSGQALEIVTGLPTADCDMGSGFATPKYFHLSPDGRVGAYDHSDFLFDWRTGTQTGLDDEELWWNWTPFSKAIYAPLEWHSLRYLALADNLLLQLRPRLLVGNVGIELELTVADRHLDRYTLDYAGITAPTDFHPIGTGSREPIYSEIWGTWIPPAAGRYILRLTAYDLAGNVHTTTQTVTWSGTLDIANLYSETRFISPTSSPGVKDDFVFHFDTFHACTLTFRILNADNVEVRRMLVQVTGAGPLTATWDGTDQNNHPVPDGVYYLEYMGARWPVTVDNQPPDLSFEISENKPAHDPGSGYVNDLDVRISDANFDNWRFESRPYGQTTVWEILEQGNYVVSEEEGSRWRRNSINWIVEKEFRLIATDLAGNVSEVQRYRRQEQITFSDGEPPCRSSQTTPCVYPDRPAIKDLEIRGSYCPIGETNCVNNLESNYNTLFQQNSIWGFDLTRMSLRYRKHFPPNEPWESGTIQTSPDGPGIYWDHPGLAPSTYEVQLLAPNQENVDILSPVVLFVVPNDILLEYVTTDSSGARFAVSNLTDRTLYDIELPYRVIYENATDSWINETLGKVAALAPGETAEISSGCTPFYYPTQDIHLRAQGRDTSQILHYSNSVPYLIKTVYVGYDLTISDPGSCDTPPSGLFEQRSSIPGRRLWSSPGGQSILTLNRLSDPTGGVVTGLNLLVGNSDLGSIWPSGSLAVDFSQFPEGIYAVNQFFQYADGQQGGLLSECNQHPGPTIALIVDRTPPQMSILYPEEGQVICRPANGIISVSLQLSDNLDASPTIEIPWRYPDDCGLGPHVHAGSGPFEVYAWDIAQNMTCSELRSYTVYDPRLSAQPQLFSPEVTTAGYSNTSRIALFPLGMNGNFEGRITTLDSQTVRVLNGSLGGQQYFFEWDGKNDDGDLVGDGNYPVDLDVTGDCASHLTLPNFQYAKGIEVDKTPPNITVLQPVPYEEVGATLEIRGMLVDKNLDYYKIEIHQVDACETCWTDLTPRLTEPAPNIDDLLWTWNTQAYPPDQYDLRVYAIDKAGNEFTTPVITISVRERQYIKNFERTPDIISPNGDTKNDFTDISYELYQTAANVSLKIVDADNQTVVNFDVSQNATQGSAQWHGIERPDAPYTVVLTAGSETERLSIIQDNTPPSVVVTRPDEGPYATPLDVIVSAQDAHPDNYEVLLLNQATTSESLEAGNGNITDRVVGTLVDRPDGNYAIQLTATDRAQNSNSLLRPFILDSTAPVAQILEPARNAYLNQASGPIELSGGVFSNLRQTVEWAYAAGTSPGDGEFFTICTAAQCEWNASGLDDGAYTLKLYVSDQLLREQQDRIVVTLDSTPPVVDLQTPTDGQTITGPTAITGQVTDDNPGPWKIRATSPSGEEFEIGTGSGSVNGTLTNWSILPPDGPYLLILSATDRAGNTSETAARTVTLAATVPDPPVLTAVVENARNVRLAWNMVTNASFYRAFRDGSMIAEVAATELVDQTVAQGSHTYTVRAVNAAGESCDSNPATVFINYDSPIAIISSPPDNQHVSGTIEIRGSAYSENDFKQYQLFIRSGPDDWTLLMTRTAPVNGGLLGTWDTMLLVEGDWSIRLRAEDIYGNSSSDQLSVVIDNTPPLLPPFSLTATVEAQDPDGDNDDVVLQWDYEPDPDVTGFYLYRDNFLANAPNPLIGPRTPYRLDETTHTDKNVPDGTHVYRVSATDSADNESALSSEVPVTIETGRPKAAISSPSDNSKFNVVVELTAVCQDLDAQVQFEYQAGSGSWMSIGSLLLQPPFLLQFQAGPGSWGPNNFRVRARDAGGWGPYSAVIHTLNEPIAPELAAQVLVGGDAKLTWTAEDPYGTLDGFNLYRGGALYQTLPTSPLQYVDPALPAGSYSYSMTLIDNGYASHQSTPLSVTVRSPKLNYMFPITDSNVTVSGSDSPATTQAKLESKIAGDFQPLADATILNGNFAFLDLNLSQGLHTFRAYTTDAASNYSRYTDQLAIVRHPRPLPVASATYTSDGSNVTLSWTVDQPDAESAGFRVARSSGGPFEIINETSDAFAWLPSHVVEASSSPSTATAPVDADPLNGWQPAQLPASWQWTWTVGIELKQVLVGWQAGHVAQAFDVDVQADGEWLWFRRIVNNVAASVTVPIGIRATGIRIRLPKNITANVVLTTVSAQMMSRTVGLDLPDNGLTPGTYEYRITQINRWGQESDPYYLTARVGLPQIGAPTLSADAGDGCGEIQLAWQPPDPFPGTITQYRVYRSNQTGGPYTMVASTTAVVQAFTDTVSVAGYYRVSAVGIVDSQVTESGKSNEATAPLQCSDPPPPVITLPTTADRPISWTQATVDVSGLAIPGSTITLFQNGVPGPSATATAGQRRNHSLLHDARLSADGRFAAGTMGYEVYWRDLLTNDELWLASSMNAADAAVSPDGRWIAYTSDKDNPTGQDLYLFDRRNQTETRVPYEGYADTPAFSIDGGFVAFVGCCSPADPAKNELLVYDTRTGTLREPYSYQSETDYPWFPVFSPDGSRIAMEMGTGVVIVNLADLQSQVISGTEPHALSTSPFSPDGNRLVYSIVPSHDFRQASLWQHDWLTNTETPLSASPGEFNGAFSGARLVFLSVDGSDIVSVVEKSADGLIDRPIAGGFVASALSHSPSELNLQTSTSGLLFVQQAQDLAAITDAGGFYFEDQPLAGGPNQFVARQVGAGAAADSETVIIHHDVDLPDVQAVGVVSFPAFPIGGESVLISAAVANIGTAPLSGCQVILQMTSPSGATAIMLDETVDLAPGQIRALQYNWNTAGSNGDFLWELSVDPDQLIIEDDENNNAQQVLVPVRISEGIDIGVATNQAAYSPGDTSLIHVSLFSNAPPGDYVVKTVAEDLSGYLVAQIDTRTLENFGNGSTEYNVLWVVPDIYPGDYRVRASVLRQGSVQVEATAPFAVLAEVNVETEVSTALPIYTIGQPVAISGSVTNAGSSLLSGLTATLAVRSQAGMQVAAETRPIAQLPAGSTAPLSWSWPSDGASPGLYRTRLEVSDSSGLLSVHESGPFELIEPSVTLSGSLQLSAVRIEPGDALIAAASAVNPSSTSLTAVELTLALIDPQTMLPVWQSTVQVDLPPGSTYSFEQPLDTVALSLQFYIVGLHAAAVAGGQTINQELATATLAVADLSPPDVQLVSPSPGALACDSVPLQITAVDAVSGVLRAFYRRDGNPVEQVLQPGEIANLYSASWPIAAGEDGAHQFELAAQDAAGNASQAIVVSVSVDSQPPAIDLQAPAGGTCSNQAVTIVFSATDPHLNGVSATLNGQSIASGSQILADGNYNLLVTASDDCGHTTQEARSFRIQTTPPLVTVASPSEGECAAPGIVPTFHTTPEGLTVTATLDGQPYAPGTPITAEASHTLAAAAEDSCNNTGTSEVVHFVVDGNEPVLTIAGVEDQACYDATVIPQFSAVDPNLQEVAATMNGAPFESGTSVQAEGDYELTVRATDSCENETTQTAHFTIDLTDPAIVLEGVENGGRYDPPLTLQWAIDDLHPAGSNAVLNGIAIEPGAVVSEYGKYYLSITATDCAGNQSSVSIRFNVDWPQYQVEHAVDRATPRVLFLDNEKAGNSVSSWLHGTGLPIEETGDACDFLGRMRSGLFDAYVFNDPSSSEPLPFDSCFPSACPPAGPCGDLAHEFSSHIYDRSGLLFVGATGQEGNCFLSKLQALGCLWDSPYLESAWIDDCGTIFDLPGPISIQHSRTLSLQGGGFPGLLSAIPGSVSCAGIRAATLSWNIPLPPTVGWIRVALSMPLIALDEESGELADGQTIDANHGPWADLAIQRIGNVLKLHVTSADGSELPERLLFQIYLTGPHGQEITENRWIGIDCASLPGQTIDHFLIESIANISYNNSDRIVASGNRYGLGAAATVGWDPWPEDTGILDQALQAVLPDTPRSIVPGSPATISVAVSNGAAGDQLRIEADIPAGLFLESSIEPVSIDPLIWELTMPDDGSTELVYWIRMPDAGGSATIPLHVWLMNCQEPELVHYDVLEVTPEGPTLMGQTQSALQDIDALLAQWTDGQDAEEAMALQQARAILEEALLADPATSSPEVIECLLSDLTTAYDILMPFRSGPPEQRITLKIARVLAGWEALWVVQSSPSVPAGP